MVILIHVDWVGQLRLYKRLKTAYESLGHKVIFTSASFSSWLRLKLRGNRVALTRYRKVDKIPLYDLGFTREAKCFGWSPHRLASFHDGVMEALQSLHNRFRLECLLVWNGDDVVGAVFREFATEQRIPIGFLESPNIDGKLFVDPEGANARASIAREPDRLLHYATSSEQFEAWRSAYVSKHLKIHLVPQAMSEQPMNWWTLMDLLGSAFGVPYVRSELLLAKVKRILLRQGAASMLLPENDAIDLSGNDYVFFPLQLSLDTNVKLHSSVDNEHALHLAAAEARSRGCHLVVKVHPAEVDREFVRRMGQLTKSLGCIVTRANTFELIANAQLVVTINSTIGLEARLLGRPVKHYGEALYGKFDDRHLRSYLMEWLLDIDPRSDNEIPPKIAAALLSRIGVRSSTVAAERA